MKILIIQGHPDPAGGHYCHALADAYAEGAAAGGHEVRRIETACQDIAFLPNSEAYHDGEAPAYALAAQDDIRWADHIVLVFPLWMGGMPARLKAWMEQTFRHGFAFDTGPRSFTRHLKGKSAHMVVTMGMPAFFYRLYFRAHGTKMLRRSILGFAGIGPVRQTLIGRVEDIGDGGRKRWLERMEQLGREAA